MKIRSIHPGFFGDAKITSVSYPARILYAGLWCHCDDYGRAEWLPKRIEGDVFPTEDVDIMALLAELLQVGLIRVYRPGSKLDPSWYLFIPKWETYQSPKYRTKRPCPDPEGAEILEPHDIPGIGPKLVPTRVQPGSTLSPRVGVGVGVGVGDVEGVSATVPTSTRNGQVSPEIWNTLTELFGQPAPTQRSLYARLGHYLDTQLETHPQPSAEIRRRCALIVQEWNGTSRVTPASLEKWWSRYDGEIGTITDDDAQRAIEQAELTKWADDMQASLGDGT